MITTDSGRLRVAARAAHVEPVFEDALVDRPELLDRQISIIDVFGRTVVLEVQMGHAEIDFRDDAVG